MSLPEDYIDVVRTFLSETDSKLLSPGQEMGNPANWDELLSEKAHIVLIGASGMGKTREMEAQACRLRQAGGSAFYLSARDISSHGFCATSLGSESEAFNTWMSTDEKAVIFVDAIDELAVARLSVASLVNRLLEHLKSQPDWQLVLSTRTGGWPESVARHFTKIAAQTKGYPRVATHTLMSLNTDSIRAFADRWAKDPEAFMNALAEDELERMLEVRPYDLRGMIDSWNTHSSLGSWHGVLANIVSGSLASTNLERDIDRELTPEQGDIAARRIGASTILTQTTYLALPGEINAKCLASDTMFGNWSSALRRELFETHLFVRKGEGTVQLLQGDVPSFLAARWLADRVRGGKSIDWLRNRLLVSLYGGSDRAIPSHLQNTAGWLASELPEFRRSIQDEFPVVVLFRGDPDVLTSSEVLSALDALLRQFRQRPIDPWPTPRTLVKLARPDLEEEIVARLRHEKHPGAKHHLLEWCYAGRYSSAVAVAVSIAANPGEGPTAMAVSVVGRCGDYESKKALLALAVDANLTTFKELLEVLVPLLAGQELVDLLTCVEDKRVYRVTKFLGAVSDSDLQLLFSALRSSSRRTSDLLFVVAIELAKRGGDSEDLVAALLDVELATKMTVRRVPETDVKSLSAVLETHQSLRRGLWEERLERAATETNYPVSGRFGVRVAADIPWLFTRFETATDPRDWHSRLAIRSIYDSLALDVQVAIRESDVPSGLLELLSSFDESNRETEERQRQFDAEREAEEIAERELNRAAILKRMPTVLTGEDLAVLNWVMEHALHEHTRSLSRDKVVALVGDLADGVVQGFKAFWRGNDVAIPDPTNNKSWGSTLVGLSGIGFEVGDGLDFASLHSDEVKLATRYALHELNAFPSWLSTLLAAHPKEVRGVLAESVALEWQDDVLNAWTIQRASYCEESLGRAIREIVVSKIIEGPQPGSANVLSSVVDVCLLKADYGDLANAVKKNAQGELHKSQWLRLWSHLQPCPAASWFEAHLSTSTDEVDPILLEVAGHIGRDLDEGRNSIKWTGLKAPEALERWAALLVGAFPFEKDLKHAGVYSPGPRDHAQTFRNQCLNMLSKNSSVEARSGLLRLQKAGLPVTYLLEEQRGTATGSLAEKWTIADILSVEQGDRKKPRSPNELFRMACEHLDSLANELENDEFSCRELFKPDTKEREIQQWVAKNLEKEAGSLYSVVRENVVDKDKEVDITACANGVGKLPIEIKPSGGDYSCNALEACIRDQLLGQYMTQHDRDHGIFLFVHHKPKPIGWEIGTSKGCSVDALMEHLREFARSVAEPRGKQIAVQLINVEDNRKRAS